MSIKSDIYITQKDNNLYFDNTLSTKHNELVIQRIIRNIKTESEVTGIVTRRGKCPLIVVKINERWKIKGELEESQDQKIKKQESSWDSLTRHEQILLTAVKFDIHEDFEQNEKLAEEAFNDNCNLLSGIMRFQEGEIYFLDNQKYKIVKNNKKKIIYYGPNGEEKRTLEADSFGEFFRPDVKIIHSADKIIS